MDWPEEKTGHRWREARSVSPRGYLNAAACNIPSDATLRAVVDHLGEERRLGGFRAADNAALTIDTGRRELAGYVGAEASDVGFVESGTAAMAALLGGLSLPAGARIGVVRSEFGSTRMLVDRLAAERGWQVVQLLVDQDSRILLDALEPALARGLDLVVLSHIASQRGVVQPAREVGELCRRAAVPLLVDVCQSLGHVDVSGIGATAYVGTSRKWLCGPRGVGFVIVPGLPEGAGWAAFPPTIQGYNWGAGEPVPLAGAARFESAEAAVASRVGLSVAVREHLALEPDRVYARLAGLGAATRRALHGIGGWQAVEPLDEPSAIVTLRPPRTADAADASEAVAAVVRRAAAADLHVGAIPVSRAPADMPMPCLRVSPPLGARELEIDGLVAVLDRKR